MRSQSEKMVMIGDLLMTKAITFQKYILYIMALLLLILSLILFSSSIENKKIFALSLIVIIGGLTSISWWLIEKIFRDKTFSSRMELTE